MLWVRFVPACLWPAPRRTPRVSGPETPGPWPVTGVREGREGGYLGEQQSVVAYDYPQFEAVEA